MTKQTIIHISDTHLTPLGREPSFNQELNPYKKLQRVFEDVQKMDNKPNYVVITGDLIHEGQASDYAHLKEMLAQQENELLIPIYVVLGNHDRTKAFYSGYLSEPAKQKYYYKKHINETDNYFLDTTFENLEQGYLDQNQLTWLSNNLSQNPNTPALIFMHHPISGASLTNMRFSILQNGSELLNLCKNFNVKGIFSGHIHFSTTYLTDSILNSVSDSTAYHIDCRKHHQHYVSDVISYNIITLSDDAELGIENRYLYCGQKIVKKLTVEKIDFINSATFTK
ncbi:3',5'-cyclic-nucleotide phosphodiesterase [Leuconostoc litchii]|uniref:Metallophosphoesterase n=1 Tax=Leuconostoc litchii TaxID=1981069 RepID=A0A6P2CS47_9LACO|nr:metallophosphoesterase [Leuconostoc litchii]TYC47601.1 metallophosphoesterase [Leuconostoc litchii]GMA69646.1 3',5'-cyclic-nucleotide phosphodiesterase [Leuconostoc litchii]